MKEIIRELLPRTPRPHCIRFGPLRGAKIVTSWHDYPGAILGRTEAPLLRWFRSNVGESETWLDVGAHYGYTAIALSRLIGPSGRVFAFEPVLSTAACVRRTREINPLENLAVVPIGLDSGSTPRILDLPTVRGMADRTIDPARPTERIETRSLDTLWPSLCAGSPVIHGIKIDVQGMELEVMSGMRELLRRWSPKLVIEFHAGVDRAHALEILADCGYGTAAEPVDPSRASAALADDCSYAFYPLEAECASSSTASFTARI